MNETAATRSYLDLAVPLGALVLLVAFFPALNDPDWAPRTGLCLLLAAIGLPIALRDATAKRGIAVAGCGLVAVALLSSALSAHSVLSLAGSYGGAAGTVLVMAIVGGWAVGERLSFRGREHLASALLAGAFLNLGVALLQGFVDLTPYRLGSPLGPSGLMGNPVHLGALLAGATALVSNRVRTRSVRWLAAIAPIGVALPFSGSRMGAAAAALACVLGARHGRRGVVVLAVFLASFAAGEMLHRTSGPETSSTSQRLASASAIQLEHRADSWVAGVRASVDRPLGYGPGRFVEVAAPATTARQAQTAPDTDYRDAHNFFVEYLATTGWLGALLLVAMLIALARSARGELAAFAWAAALIYLLQPQSLAITPLVFVALGAASPQRATRAPARLVSPVLVTAALAVVAVLIAGDFALRQADLDFHLGDARRAERLLFAWPEASSRRGVVLFFHATSSGEPSERQLDASEDAFERAAKRDPAIATHWNNLADVQLFRGQRSEATMSFERALTANPYSLRALVGLATIAAAKGDIDGARAHIERAKEIVPESDVEDMVNERVRRSD